MPMRKREKIQKMLRKIRITPPNFIIRYSIPVLWVFIIR